MFEKKEEHQVHRITLDSVMCVGVCARELKQSDDELVGSADRILPRAHTQGYIGQSVRSFFCIPKITWELWPDKNKKKSRNLETTGPGRRTHRSYESLNTTQDSIHMSEESGIKTYTTVSYGACFFLFER